ncbi:MAG: non-canonical purine NTP pyrophosphatase, partial [Pseudomonadota bacterium]
RRRGYFCAVLCLCWPDGEAQYFRGEAPGTLIWPPRGDDGFGYDPVFVPQGETRHSAELPRDLKNRISHRGQALALLAQRLAEFLAAHR